MSRRRDAAAAAADDAAADAGRPSDLRSSSPNLRSSSLCGEWRCGDGGRRGGDGDHLYELGDDGKPRADGGRLPRFGERRALAAPRGDAERRGTGSTSGGAGNFASSLGSAAANCAGASGGAAAMSASLAGLEDGGGALGGATVGLEGLEAAALLGGATSGVALLGRDGAFAESSGRRA